MEFGGDPSTPVFNGYLAKIQLRLGSGAWVSDKDGFKMLYQGELALPDKLKLNQERVTVPILKDEEKVDSTKEREPQLIGEEVADCKEEYSVSGWSRWVDPATIGPWHLLVRLAVIRPDTLENLSRAGDRTLAIWKGAGYFHFATYTTNQENAVNANAVQNCDYDGYLHYSWFYVYFGYSKKQQKAHAYIKYTTREHHLEWTVNHYAPTIFTMLIQKDKWHPGINGFMKQWYLNSGEGAYRLKEYDDGETEKITFGYGAGLKPYKQTKEWKPEDELFNVEWGRTLDTRKVKCEVELKDDGEGDTRFNGVTEYGYGMWTRFLWNALGEKLIDKPAWMALSRMTIRPNYQGDAA